MEEVSVVEVSPAVDDVVEAQIVVRLHAADYKKIVSTKQDLGKVATYFLEHYAKGGVLLRAAQAHYIEQVAGIPVKTPETIISIIESGVSRRSANGSLNVTYSVDPAFAQPLEDLATAQGRTVEEIVAEGMSIVFTNQWLYSLDVAGLTLHFGPEDTKHLQAMVGSKTITGSDLMQWAYGMMDKKNPRISKVREEVRARLDAAHAEA